ncbi:hypothetical protein F4778DRAFT_784104 [Xylariomycetidae sp. FL2044]|nr:hypothetical protein F4778DRAFT_784104 [Xylariomycetidae sp. FL2044]
MSSSTAKASPTWEEDNVNLLLLIMYQDNPEFNVKGWKKVAEQSNSVLKGTYSVPALKQQFAKLRRGFLARLEAEDGAEDEAEDKPKNKRAKTLKRSAGDKADDTARTAKKRGGPRKGKAVQKKKAPVDEDDDEDDEDDDDDDDEDEVQGDEDEEDDD